MGVSESDNGAVAILIAGAVTVSVGVVALAETVGYQFSLRAQLNETERGTGAGISVPHVVGADEGVDMLIGTETQSHRRTE